MTDRNEFINMKFLKRAVLKCPNKVAVKDKKNQYSYKELDNMSDVLAYYLTQCGIVKGDCVGIFMENNSEYILCVLAIMKVAAIFVPIATQYPAERLTMIVKNCTPKVILTNENNITKIMGIAIKNDISTLDLQTINYTYKTNKIEPKLMPQDVAYIIYTSGSTGVPKGVAIRWESLNNYIQDTCRQLEFDDGLISLNMTPFYFDGALTGIFCTLISQGTLVISPSNIMRANSFINLLEQEKISDLGCTPIQLKILAEALMNRKSKNNYLKTIAIGGESFSAVYVKQIMDCILDIKILNRYGPTETTIVVSSYQINKEDILYNNPFPIGKPIANVIFYAINEQKKEIRENEVGELYIGGIQIMEGYWNDPSLTEKVICEDLLPNTKLYRSGDLVTIDKNGNYIYIGRVDDMIKKNGYRIYLSEVENALEKIVYIEHACCIAIKNENSSEIVAFIMKKDKDSEKKDMDYVIRQELSSLLPIYMLPNKIIIVDKFPITSTGKIDRNKLKTNLYNLK